MLSSWREWGGEWPIGFLSTLYRLWSRCRRKCAKAWERHHSREYFWASEGRSSEEAARHQGIHVEAARASLRFQAGLLTDMKAYEHVSHEKLLDLAVPMKFPLALLWMCLAAYSGPRRIIVDGLCTQPFAIGGESCVVIHLIQLVA